MYLKFNASPDDNKICADLDHANLHNARIQRYGPPANNEVLIRLEEKETSELALDRGKNQIIQALEVNAPSDKQDINNASMLSVQNYLLEKDPQHLGTDANQRYQALAQAIVNYRDRTKGGVLNSLDELGAVAPAEVTASLQPGFFVSDFGVRNVEIVGPQVGKKLQNQA